MPVQFTDEPGIIYYTSTEAQKYLGIGSFVTFQGIVVSHQLEFVSKPGRGRTKYYKKSDLDKVPRFNDDWKSNGFLS